MSASTTKREAAALVPLICPWCSGDLRHDPEAGTLYESRVCRSCGLVVRIPVAKLVAIVGRGRISESELRLLDGNR